MSHQLTQIVNIEQAIALLHEHKATKQNSIFKVVFTKRTTGEKRTMNARFGVKKGVTGEGLKYSPDDKKLISCYDMDKARELMNDENAEDKRAFRMIASESIEEVTIDGTRYLVQKA